MMKNRDTQIIFHILLYCNKIKKSVEPFMGNLQEMKITKYEMNKDVCAFYLLQIGELVNVLSEEFKQKHKQIPWREIKGMRNVIAHHYGVADTTVIIETIDEDIPKLEEFCKILMDKTQ